MKPTDAGAVVDPYNRNSSGMTGSLTRVFVKSNRFRFPWLSTIMTRRTCDVGGSTKNITLATADVGRFGVPMSTVRPARSLSVTPRSKLKRSPSLPCPVRKVSAAG